MHRDAATTGDVADNLIARYGVAARGELREQVSHAQHFQARYRARRSRDRGRRSMLLLLVGGHAHRDLVGMNLAIADRCQKVVDRVVVERGGKGLLAGRRHAEPLELLLHELATAGDVLLALLLAEPLADLLAGVRGLDIAEVRVEPVAARALGALGREDLDNVA